MKAENEEMARVVERNIRTLLARRKEEERRAPLLTLVRAMAEKMGIDQSRDPELSELARDVRPEKVLEKMEQSAEEQKKAA